MIQIADTKLGVMLPPQLKDNGDFANNTYIDTLGYDHLRIAFIVGATDTTIGSTAEGTAPKVEECDTSDGTYADITDAALADSIAATEDDGIHLIDINLQGRKRYIQVNVPHAGDGTVGANLAIVGILSRGDAPDTATEAGVTEWVTV